MEKYDLVILLGSQVKKEENQYTLAPHTELKARAAGVAYQKGITERFIISGGYNFAVRYNESQILPRADFSFEAFTRARKEKSEAEIIRDYMRDKWGVPEEAMFLEETSATTIENVEFIKILLKRTPAFSDVQKIGILTLLYHMEGAFPKFAAGIEGKIIKPLFAEELLPVETVYTYYTHDYPKTYPKGKKWDAEKIRETLLEGRGLKMEELPKLQKVNELA